jgi:hypothetical protein
MPFISMHYPMLATLNLDWTWDIIEGVAANYKDTQWCKSIEPRLSSDGTSAYVRSLTFDPRVRVFQRHIWPGKVSMINESLKWVNDPCLLWEIDSDELWTASQIHDTVAMFEAHKNHNMAFFRCNFFVGPDLVTSTRETYGNRSGIEWRRVWRYEPGMTFETHEPPVLNFGAEKPFMHDETESRGLVFNHYAYATEKAVAFKERYYGYTGAVANWRKLQQQTTFPVRLADYLPWVEDETEVVRL